MLGFDPVSSRSISEVLYRGVSGSSQYPMWLPAMNSLRDGTVPPPAGGFEAPFAWSFGEVGAPTGGSIVIPIFVWHLKQQGIM